jgi:hypothetical protein
MIIENHWEQMFERRTSDRTRIAKSAKLFFNAVREPIDCGICDITDVGAGIRADGLKLLPISFELSYDNSPKARTCRLIWRDGDFMGVAFVA